MLTCALPGHDPLRRADNYYEVPEERDGLAAASFCLIIRFSCGAVEGRSASANRNDVPRVWRLWSAAAPPRGSGLHDHARNGLVS
jgi:hypothetical protein